MRAVLVLGMALLMLMAGCSHKATSTITSNVTDSTHIREAARIVPISLPGQKVSVNLLVKCDSVTNQPIPVEISSTEGDAFIALALESDGTLKATGGCDSLKTEIEARDKIIERFRKEVKKEETVRMVTVYETKPIDKFCRRFTGISLLLLVGYGFYKLNKLNPL